MPPPNNFAFPRSQATPAPTATSRSSGGWGVEEYKPRLCSVAKGRDEFQMVLLFISYVRASVSSPVKMGLVPDLSPQLSCHIASSRKPSLALCILVGLGSLLLNSLIAFTPIHQALRRLTPGTFHSPLDPHPGSCGRTSWASGPRGKCPAFHPELHL